MDSEGGELDVPLLGLDNAPPPRKKSCWPAAGGIRISTLMLFNGTVGAGTFTVPFILARSGVGLGLGCLFSSALCSYAAQRLLFKASKVDNITRYDVLVRSAFGNSMAMVTRLTLILATFGALTSFQCVVTSLVPPFLEIEFPDLILADKKVFTAIVVGGLTFPLSMLRSPQSLWLSSWFGVFALFCVIVIMTIRLISPAEGQDELPDIEWSKSIAILSRHLPGCYSLSSQLFCCHWMVLPLFAELKRPSLRRIYRVGWQNNIFAFILYSFAGLVGFLSFGTIVKGDVLDSYYQKDVLALVAKVLVTFYLAVTSALLAIMMRLFLLPFWVTCDSATRTKIRNAGVEGKSVTARSGFEVYEGVGMGSDDSDEDESDIVDVEQKKMSLLWVAVQNVVILGLSSYVAITVPDVTTLFGLTGAITGTVIGLILPGLMFLKITTAKKRDPNEQKKPWYSPLVGPANMSFGKRMSLTFIKMSPTSTVIGRNRKKDQPEEYTSTLCERTQAIFLIVLGSVIFFAAPYFIVTTKP